MQAFLFYAAWLYFDDWRLSLKGYFDRETFVSDFKRKVTEKGSLRTGFRFILLGLLLLLSKVVLYQAVSFSVFNRYSRKLIEPDQALGDSVPVSI